MGSVTNSFREEFSSLRTHLGENVVLQIVRLPREEQIVIQRREVIDEPVIIIMS